MSDMSHTALGLIALIFHLARHMHGYSQTSAPPTGDLMITFAEQVKSCAFPSPRSRWPAAFI